MSSANRIQEYGLATALTPFTLTAAVAGYNTFSSAFTPGGGDTFKYTAENVDDPTEWEIGTGVILIDGTLSRTPIESSVGVGSGVTFAAGSAIRVFNTRVAGEAPEPHAASHLGGTDDLGLRVGTNLAIATDTFDLDFSLARLQERVATGDIVITAINHAIDADAFVIITNSTGGVINLTFPAGWRWLTAIPATLADGLIGVLSVVSRQASDAYVVAAWKEEVV